MENKTIFPNLELLSADSADQALADTNSNSQSLLVAHLKKDKNIKDPEGYRVIGLECCLLKGLMWLIERRIRSWAIENNLIPENQNGFVEGRRTNNNAFILRTVAEQADAEGRPVYLAFLDLQNAFPSVDQNILWFKLWQLGVRGPMFDIVRLIYTHMSYNLRQDRELSEAFSSDIGILAGDPCSPLFWLLFAADCNFPEHSDDVHLAGYTLSSLFHADDLALLSYSPEGLQEKINCVLRWCSTNNLVLSPTKSFGMIFRSKKVALPKVFIGDTRLQFKDEGKYVGVWFCGNTKHLSCAHVVHKADIARHQSNGVFSTNSYFGTSPYDALCKLYFARVDPHLTHAFDVFIGDSPFKFSCGPLDSAQLRFLRRLLSCNSKSFKDMLYTETGILPIYHRRLILALSAHAYYMNTPPNSIVYYALQVSNALSRRGKSSWTKDLVSACKNLKLIPNYVDHMWFEIGDHLNNIINDIPKIFFQAAFNHVMSSQLCPLLHSNARILLAHPKSPSSRARFGYSRSYLTHIHNPKLRTQFTKFLLGQHNLSSARHHPRAVTQLCRICQLSLETEQHAIGTCEGNPALLSARRLFNLAVHQICPHLPCFPPTATTPEANSLLLIDRWSSLSKQDLPFLHIFATLVRDILNTFASH